MAAAQLFCAGVLLSILGLVPGERIEALPSAASLLALAYLIVFGSIVAYSAYDYLLHHTRPALATSYAYVNPAVTVLLGVPLGAKVVTGHVFVALPLILSGAAVVTLAQRFELSEPAGSEIRNAPEDDDSPLGELVDDAV